MIVVMGKGLCDMACMAKPEKHPISDAMRATILAKAACEDPKHLEDQSLGLLVRKFEESRKDRHLRWTMI